MRKNYFLKQKQNKELIQLNHETNSNDHRFRSGIDLSSRIFFNKFPMICLFMPRGIYRSNGFWFRRISLRKAKIQTILAVYGEDFYAAIIITCIPILLTFSESRMDFLLNALAYTFIARIDNLGEKTFEFIPKKNETV